MHSISNTQLCSSAMQWAIYLRTACYVRKKKFLCGGCWSTYCFLFFFFFFLFLFIKHTSQEQQY